MKERRVTKVGRIEIKQTEGEEKEREREREREREKRRERGKTETGFHGSVFICVGGINRSS